MTQQRELHEAFLDGLKRDYGYRPDESRENWTIFNGNLLVADPDHLPRLYRPGCNGIPVEIKPHP